MVIGKCAVYDFYQTIAECNIAKAPAGIVHHDIIRHVYFRIKGPENHTILICGGGIIVVRIIRRIKPGFVYICTTGFGPCIETERAI
jgi:hypothetical protein